MYDWKEDNCFDVIKGDEDVINVYKEYFLSIELRNVYNEIENNDEEDLELAVSAIIEDLGLA